MCRTGLRLGLCFLSLLGTPLAGMGGDGAERITVPEHGGMSFATAGASPAVATGYVEVDPDPGNAVPAGTAIIAWRDHNVTISETEIAAAAPLRAGRTYTEIAANINTGIAIVNPNAQDATINFSFTTETGTVVATGTVLVPGKTQLAKYFTEMPFHAPFMNGTFTFSSSVSVVIVAIRAITNERRELLMSTVPIIDFAAATTSTTLIPIFADGAGWITTLVLVNPTDQRLTGTVEFFDQGSSGVPGQPTAITVEGRTDTKFAFSIAPNASARMQTSGSGTSPLIGSIVITPAAPTNAPAAVALLSYRPQSVTISEVSVPMVRPAAAVRLAIDAATDNSGVIKPAVAVVNASSTAVLANFEVTDLDGKTTGVGQTTIPGNGQVTVFLSEIPGMALPSRFEGVLRVSTSSAAGIGVVGLRSHLNERGEFLVSATPAVAESEPAGKAPVFFPQLVDGGGYTTRLALFSVGSSSAGSLSFVSPTGRATSLPFAYRLPGVNFSPYVDGQDPNSGSQVTEQQLKSRLALITSDAKWVRGFGSTAGLENFGRVSRELGFKVAASAWLSRDLVANEREITNLITSIRAGYVDIAIVGSEVLLRGDLTAQQLIGYMQRVQREAPGVPVTTADVYSQLLEQPTVLAASDLVMVNYYPFWEGIRVQNAVGAIHAWHQRVIAAAGGKPVVVSETGWPSCGNVIGEAVPSSENASFFFLNFVSWVRSNNIAAFYFEATDESWKAKYEGPQGACWGIRDKDGKLKPGMLDVFQGRTIVDNWSPREIPCAPGSPRLRFTYVPAYGSFDDLKGQACDLNPTEYRVVVYIKVGSGWWVKPFGNQPITTIQNDGSWTTDTTTGGVDQTATEIVAYLVRNGFNPPILLGSATIPQTLDQNAVAQARVQRTVCEYSVTPASQVFAADGQGGSITVTVNSGCNWKAVSNEGWITVTAGTSGGGNGTVRYAVAANVSGISRTGTLTIAGQTFTVTQANEGISCGSGPTTITYGTTIICSIPTLGGSNIFRFVGTFGDLVRIQGSLLTGLNFQPCVELIRPNNTRTVACALSVFNRLDLLLDQTGMYTILVSDVPGALATGSYTLALERLLPPSPTAVRIQYGDVHTDESNPPGDFDLYWFEARAGDNIRVTASSLGGVNFQACVELTGPAPDDKPIASCEYWVPARIDRVLSQSGVYSILVRDDTGIYGVIAAGKYSLSLQCLGGPCAQATMVASPRGE